MSFIPRCDSVCMNLYIFYTEVSTVIDFGILVSYNTSMQIEDYKLVKRVVINGEKYKGNATEYIYR